MLVKRIIVVSLLCLSFAVSAQEPSEKYSRFSMGLGGGQDFGGFGTRFTVSTIKQLGVFAGLGYNFAGIGFNGGVVLRLTPDKIFCPTMHAMYGYNGLIIYEDSPESNKSYYGFTMGGGLEIKPWHNEHYFSLEVLLPFRTQEFQNDLNTIQDSGTELRGPWPVSISLGFHFTLF